MYACICVSHTNELTCTRFMGKRMYVCMYVCTYIYIYTYINTQTNKHTLTT